MVGVRGTYDRYAYAAEKRHAFEALSAQLARIVRGGAPVADLAVERAARKRGRRK